MKVSNKVGQELVLLIMTKDFDDETNNDEEVLQLDNFCEECKKEDPLSLIHISEPTRRS